MWYSFSFSSWNHIQQWLEQLAKSNHFTYFITPNCFPYLYRNRMVSCSFINWLFLSVSISFSNFGLSFFPFYNNNKIKEEHEKYMQQLQKGKNENNIHVFAPISPYSGLLGKEEKIHVIQT